MLAGLRYRAKIFAMERRGGQRLGCLRVRNRAAADGSGAGEPVTVTFPVATLPVQPQAVKFCNWTTNRSLGNQPLRRQSARY